MNMSMRTLYVEKVVVNTGIGRLSSQPNFEEKILPEITKEISLLTGQKAAFRPAKKSVAGFKLRAGTVVGLKTTLRRKRMLQFLQKIIRVVLPRVRDFRGLNPEAVDAGGNMTIGIKEHLVFPEISPEASKVNFGMELTLVPKLRNKEKALELYKELGIPFKK